MTTLVFLLVAALGNIGLFFVFYKMLRGELDAKRIPAAISIGILVFLLVSFFQFLRFPNAYKADEVEPGWFDLIPANKAKLR